MSKILILYSWRCPIDVDPFDWLDKPREQRLVSPWTSWSKLHSGDIYGDLRTILIMKLYLEDDKMECTVDYHARLGGIWSSCTTFCFEFCGFYSTQTQPRVLIVNNVCETNSWAYNAWSLLTRSQVNALGWRTLLSSKHKIQSWRTLLGSLPTMEVDLSHYYRALIIGHPKCMKV